MRFSCNATTARTPAELLPHVVAGRLRVVRQVDLRPSDLDNCCGLIATIYLDQIDFAARSEAVGEFLARGGRIVFNGHVLRPFVEGMRPFVPLPAQRRSDLALERLAPHPVFAGIPASAHQTQKGVAGFYGRGHNPPLPGATHLTGIGPDRLPVDWEWLLPGGGGLFVHSGNDIWGDIGRCRRQRAGRRAHRRLVAGRPLGEGRGMSILAVNAGAAYQIESLEGPRYRSFFDRLVRPEELGDVELAEYGALLVPCRTAAHRIVPHADRLRAYLDRGGTVVAMGECHSEQWLPNIDFTPVETNFWWWLEPGGDLGVSIASPAHPLFRRLGRGDLAWHLHGFFAPPSGADVLIADRDGRAILYVDEVTTRGRMIVTSLDPFFHHGHHFMPATTSSWTGSWHGSPRTRPPGRRPPDGEAPLHTQPSPWRRRACRLCLGAASSRGGGCLRLARPAARLAARIDHHSNAERRDHARTQVGLAWRLVGAGRRLSGE